MSQSQTRAVINSTIDPWLVGGLSIVVLLGFIILSSTIPSELILGNFIVLTVLLNGTHFMASYALLYASRTYIKRYKVAAIYLPLGLLGAGSLALWLAMPPRSSGTGIQCLMIITALYLALHYTGQAWGMMASYAHINGISFTISERKTLRRCLRTMAIWQMVWALATSPSYVPTPLLGRIPDIMSLFNVLGVGSFIIGANTLFAIRKRIGAQLPASLLLPFVSLYVWYAFLWVYPQSLFWVQIFHALQYLSFPLRVELNRATIVETQLRQTNQLRHLLKYSLALTAASLFVFVGIDKLINYPHGGYENYFLVLVCLINIHHYFIDGCIWHISNPEVRADLFAHLKRRDT
jgi:hypothetical protein